MVTRTERAATLVALALALATAGVATRIVWTLVQGWMEVQ